MSSNNELHKTCPLFSRKTFLWQHVAMATKYSYCNNTNFNSLLRL